MIVGGYIGFELVMLQKLGYRTEPTFIFEEFARADLAYQECGDLGASERARFVNNFGVVRRKAADSLASEAAEQSPETVQGQLDAMYSDRRVEVSEALARGGCGDAKVRKWMKVHEIRSGLSLR